MSIYINADSLRHRVLYFADARNLNGNHEQAKAYNHCLCMIDDEPSADVVEVVRCKDCKWYGIDELKKDGSLDRRYKPSVCYLYREHHEESWYCADAERRKDV